MTGSRAHAREPVDQRVGQQRKKDQIWKSVHSRRVMWLFMLRHHEEEVFFWWQTWQKCNLTKKYTVSEIYEDLYVVVEGFENAIPSAIYWSEFVLPEKTGTTTKNQW